MLRQHGRPMPVVNQIEVNIVKYERLRPLLNYCKVHGILIQAYHLTLFSGMVNHSARWIQNSAVTGIAKRLGRTNNQVLVRWGLQLGIAGVLGSSRQERLKQNLEIFDFSLNEEYMNVLSTIFRYW